MSDSVKDERSQPWKLMNETTPHAPLASPADPNALWDDDHSTSNQNTHNIVAHVENNVTITSVAGSPLESYIDTKI